MLDISAVDLDDVAHALDDHSDESSWWLDPRTGEARFLLPGVDDETADDLDEAGLICIDPIPSWEAYQDMEEFIAEVPDQRAGELLNRAIRGRGAFRRFKDTLLEFPELRERWFAFHNARMRRRAIRWLADEGVIDTEAAERAAFEHPDPLVGGEGMA